MSFNKYYQEELTYLREMGEEFSHAYPKLAPFLSQRGHDPDVERLLEGFAFIAGRIRQKLDDELPELTHTLLSLVAPNLLRPIPSLSILRFDPLPNAINERITVNKGVEVDSVPVEGVQCRFRTCYDVDLYPMGISSAKLETHGNRSRLTVGFRLHTGMVLKNINLDTVRLYISEESYVAYMLYLFLFRYLDKVTLQDTGRRQTIPIDPGNVRPVGFSDGEEVLPYPSNAFSGYRLLQEYYSLPNKFFFFDVCGLGERIGSLGENDEFELTFEFNRRLEDRIKVDAKSFSLFCTPIINIFSKDADPIRLEHDKTEYRVRSTSMDMRYYEIYSVDRVTGWAYGGRKKFDYNPFISFNNRVNVVGGDEHYYRARIKPSIVGSGTDTFLSFINAGEKEVIPEAATISIDLTCTNRQLPERLKIGDIKIPTGNSPEFTTFENITLASQSIAPPLDSGLHWLLISNMSLNYMTLADVEALRVILSTYNYQAHYNRQLARAHEQRMQGLFAVNVQPVTRLFKGLPIRGLRTQLDIKSGNFSNEGEMFLFASVLNEFMALYASINSFNEFFVKDIDRGEDYRWKAGTGKQTLL